MLIQKISDRVIIVKKNFSHDVTIVAYNCDCFARTFPEQAYAQAAGSTRGCIYRIEKIVKKRP